MRLVTAILQFSPISRIPGFGETGSPLRLPHGSSALCQISGSASFRYNPLMNAPANDFLVLVAAAPVKAANAMLPREKRETADRFKPTARIDDSFLAS